MQHVFEWFQVYSPERGDEESDDAEQQQQRTGNDGVQAGFLVGCGRQRQYAQHEMEQIVNSIKLNQSGQMADKKTEYAENQENPAGSAGERGCQFASLPEDQSCLLQIDTRLIQTVRQIF